MQQWFHFNPSHALAGGIGGLLRHLLNPNRPWWEALVSGGLGIGLAVYLTPVFQPIADFYLDKWVGDGRVDEGQLAAAVGCMIGMTAPNIIERCIDLIKATGMKKPPGGQ